MNISNIKNASVNILGQYKTLCIFCWVYGFSYFATVFMVMIAARFAAKIGYFAFATVPMGLYYAGLMLSTIPVAKMLLYFKAKKTFVFTQCVGIISSLGLVIATFVDSFTLLILCSFFMGIWAAGLQQMRFTVSDAVPKHKKSIAISMVLSTSIFAGVFSAPLSNYATTLMENTFLAIFVTQTILLMVGTLALVLFRMPLQEVSVKTFTVDYKILQKTGVKSAIFVSALGYGIMTFLMTAVPLEMFNIKMTLEISNIAIGYHVLGMSLPTLFIGWLIANTSTQLVIRLGTTIYMGMVYMNIFIPTSNTTMVISMVMLGVGWCCLFVSGTTMLAEILPTKDRLNIQGVNDLLVFTSSMVGSTCAGIALYFIGWNMANMLVFVGAVSIFAVTVFPPKKSKN